MTPDEFKTIYERLSMSDSQIASKLAVSRSAVFRWRKGERGVSRQSAKQLTDLLREQEKEKCDG